MRPMRLLGCATLLAVACFTAGCSTGPHSKPFFATTEQDGKLYVFGYGTDEWKQFQATGKIAKPITAPKAGPNGMTVVAPNQAVLDRYLGGK